MTITVGSLFSGYEGIGLGLSAAGIEHRTLWVCDNDPAASKVLAARLPGVPNLGDITSVDWRGLAVPELLTGGFPCTDVSLAGLGAGITNSTRSGLWLVMAEAIRITRPRWVLIENVRGLLSARADCDVEPCSWCLGDRGGDGQQPVLRALGAVLGDLSNLGYDARWVTVAASDVGAPHERMRVFVVAYQPGDEPEEELFLPAARSRWGGGADPVLTLLKTPTSNLGSNGGSQHPDKRKEGGHGPTLADEIEHLLPTARATDGTKGGPNQRGSKGDLMLPSAVAQLLPTPAVSRSGRQKSTSPGAAIRPSLDMIHDLLPTPRASNGGASEGRDTNPALNRGANLAAAVQSEQWGKYAPAIERWEQMLGRPAPAPMVPGKRAARVLSHYFTEWHMGLPEGWVTDILGREEALGALGNGVVAQQLAYGLGQMAGAPC